MGDVEGAVVAHDGVEDPEEAPGSGLGFGFELFGDGPDGFEGFRTWDVAGEHHVKVVEVGLLEAAEQVRDLLGGRFRSCPLPVSGVVAWSS